jgi:hypothetical protein
MKSIKWSLLATAALASLVFALTIQQQNVAAFNDKNNQFVFNSQNHLQISEDHGIASNSVNTFNDGTSHYNDNFNSHREETFKSNSHTKPTKDD